MVSVPRHRSCLAGEGREEVGEELFRLFSVVSRNRPICSSELRYLSKHCVVEELSMCRFLDVPPHDFAPRAARAVPAEDCAADARPC